MNNENSIVQFCEFFRTEITSIDTGNISGLTSLCKRLLLCCILDTWAKAAFPNERIGKRFSRLIREYGGWANSEKVSLTHLRKLLSLSERKNDQRFADIRRFTDAQPMWANFQEITLNQDPDFSQIDSLWPRENGVPMKIKNLWAEDIRHDYLFYKFRNNLIHEFKTSEVSGYSISDEPYYLPWKHELYYPTGFLVSLARKAIDNLEPHFKVNKIKPLDIFPFGPFLIDELNNPS